MKMRREARQLSSGDRFQVDLQLQMEVVGEVTPQGESITCQVRVVPCGPECGPACDCHSAMFRERPGPYEVCLDATQRLKYLGNLQQLLADSQRIQSQISLLQSAPAGRESSKPTDQPPHRLDR